MIPVLSVLVLLAAAPATPPPPPPAANVESLSWLAGTWEGRQGGVENEETWTVPRGGTVLGVHRDVKEGRTVGFEFLRIETTTEGLAYLASPQGRPPTAFKLKEMGKRRVVFENPGHDFPQRVLYWMGEDGSLHARIEGTMNGKAEGQEWRWTKR